MVGESALHSIERKIHMSSEHVIFLSIMKVGVLCTHKKVSVEPHKYMCLFFCVHFVCDYFGIAVLSPFSSSTSIRAHVRVLGELDLQKVNIIFVLNSKFFTPPEELEETSTMDITIRRGHTLTHMSSEFQLEI